jgi:hypothetical protein
MRRTRKFVPLGAGRTFTKIYKPNSGMAEMHSCDAGRVSNRYVRRRWWCDDETCETRWKERYMEAHNKRQAHYVPPSEFHAASTSSLTLFLFPFVAVFMLVALLWRLTRIELLFSVPVMKLEVCD